jgi:hypothetical protein
LFCHHEQYEQFTDTIRNAMSFHIYNVWSTHQQLAEIISASAIKNNETWPFVTVPQFEIHGEYCRQTSGAETVGILPLISQANLPAWNIYSVENQGWLNESRSIIQNSGNGDTLTLSSYIDAGVTPFVFEMADALGVLPVPAANPPYAPVWYVGSFFN